MSESAPKQNRTPWIIAGVLGCLVVCLLVAVIGAGAYLFMQNSQATPVVKVITATPSSSAPSSKASSVSSVSSSVLTASSKASSVSSVSSSASLPPPVSSTAASAPVLPPPASSVSPASSVAPASSSAVSKATGGPTGKILFSKKEGDRPEDQYLWIMNADGTGAKKILDRASHGFFSPDGTKVAYYHWTDGIYVANIDGSNPKKIIGDTYTGGDYGSGVWSLDGQFLFFTAQPAGRGNIVIDRALATDGSGRTNIVAGESASLSPDGTQMVFHTCRGSECGIFKSSSNPGSEAVKVISDDGGLPAWAPAGNRIVYQKEVDGQKQLFVVNADGSGKKQLTQGANMHVSAVWSPDGNFIFYRSPEGGDWGIWVMTADGANPRKLIGGVPPVNWPYERLAVTK